jgi:hypothetical protein
MILLRLLFFQSTNLVSDQMADRVMLMQLMSFEELLNDLDGPALEPNQGRALTTLLHLDRRDLNASQFTAA